MIITKQVQNASCKRAKNALYLIKNDDRVIGTIEKPFYNTEYRAQITGKTIGIYSTKLLAVNAILQIVVGAH